VFVPDLDSILQPAGDLVYNDAPWMGNASFGEDFRFVHPKISIDVGEKVGLRSLRRQVCPDCSRHQPLDITHAEYTNLLILPIGSLAGKEKKEMY